MPLIYKPDWTHFGGGWWRARDASAVEVLRGTIVDTVLAGPDGAHEGWVFTLTASGQLLCVGEPSTTHAAHSTGVTSRTNRRHP